MDIKLFQSVFVLIVFVLSFFVLRRIINRIVKRRGLEKNSLVLINKTIKFLLSFLCVIILIFVWGIDAESLWVSITSVLGVIAIGFFAVWSILSNVIAGFFLLISDIVRINDEIKVVQDDVKGVVADITLMFVILREEDDGLIYIPNNVFFQKCVKKVKH